MMFGSKTTSSTVLGSNSLDPTALGSKMPGSATIQNGKARTASGASAIAAIALGTALMFALAGCTGQSSAGVPGTSQQTVSDVMQEQMNSSSAQADAAPAGAFVGDAEDAYTDADVDVDLTSMGADMVYATVYDMLCYPEKYEGKLVRMDGQFTHSRDDVHDKDRYFVIIQDATACCAQGLEFVWGDGTHAYPAEYPSEGEEVVVTGTYQLYTEDTMNYVHLVDSSMTKA